MAESVFPGMSHAQQLCGSIEFLHGPPKLEDAQFPQENQSFASQLFRLFFCGFSDFSFSEGALVAPVAPAPVRFHVEPSVVAPFVAPLDSGAREAAFGSGSSKKSEEKPRNHVTMYTMVKLHTQLPVT